MSEDIERQAAHLAAQVDARLSGEPIAVVAVPSEPEVIVGVEEVVAHEEPPSSTLAPIAYQVLATDTQGLVAAQAKMVQWASDREAQCRYELAEEAEAHRIAKERRWATARYRKNMRELERRVSFYEKLREALQAGYVIVPNFEMDVFAIRVDASSTSPPTQLVVVQSWTRAHGERGRFRQPPEPNAEAGGKYVNPLPVVYKATRMKSATETEHIVRSCGWDDIAFPAALARPALMERVAEVEHSKLFDEIGVAVDSNRQRFRGARVGDPILLGRIRNPRSGRPDVTFFLGWYFDATNI